MPKSVSGFRTTSCSNSQSLEQEEYPMDIKNLQSLALPEEKKAWFVHDRFGMFVHWGLYALLKHAMNGSRAAKN